eukprot:Skav218724  [mRNA]  locus=scaffold1346:775602:783492:+ [translate_table: standard]
MEGEGGPLISTPAARSTVALCQEESEEPEFCASQDASVKCRVRMGACLAKAECETVPRKLPRKPSVQADGLELLKIVRKFLQPQVVSDGEEFLGSPDEDFEEGEDVVISFPGIYDEAWKAIRSKGFVTTTVWMPQGTPGYGEHAAWSEGKCYCHHLYGEEGRWGCRWFEKWLQKLQVARDRGCNLIVVARGDFSLGPSQKGILAWVEKKRIPVRLMSIDEFAVEFFGRANGFTHMGRKILEMNASDKIDFTGSESDDFQRSQLAIVSYPGAHGFGWNQLTQGSSLGKRHIVTSCIFLPNEDSEGYGKHCDRGFGKISSCSNDFSYRDGCHCDYLYPFPKYRAKPDFGCAWYEMWTKKTVEAYDRGCHLIVVTKQDGTLGNSQEGEVRFLESQGMIFERISIAQFALMLLLTRGDLQSRSRSFIQG